MVYDAERTKALRAEHTKRDNEALSTWLRATWPDGLPELWLVHEALLKAELRVEGKYRPYGGEVKTRSMPLTVGTMRQLARRIKALGMACKPRDPDEPTMSAIYRRELGRWAVRLVPADGDMALAELRHSCNQHMRSICFGFIPSKTLGMWLRSKGWQSVRRSDGTWVLRIKIGAAP